VALLVPSTLDWYPGRSARKVVTFVQTVRHDSLSFTVQFHPTPVMVTLTADRMTLAVNPVAANRPVKVSVGGDVRELCPGESSEFMLRREPVAARQVGHD